MRRATCPTTRSTAASSGGDAAARRASRSRCVRDRLELCYEIEADRADALETVPPAGKAGATALRHKILDAWRSGSRRRSSSTPCASRRPRPGFLEWDAWSTTWRSGSSSCCPHHGVGSRSWRQAARRRGPVAPALPRPSRPALRGALRTARGRGARRRPEPSSAETGGRRFVASLAPRGGAVSQTLETAAKMVEAAGIEPASEWLPARASTCVAPARSRWGLSPEREKPPPRQTLLSPPDAACQRIGGQPPDDARNPLGGVGDGRRWL